MAGAEVVGRRRVALVAAAVAVAALLPFARGLLLGRSLYFRDLSLQFMPLRRFALDGLRSGELRYWNPYAHEGAPLAPPPVGYLPDLLQLLQPDEMGISWSLALHVAFAAVAFLAFARGRGLPLAAAACGSLVYALGGFALSSVNLYVYVQALAWAPLVVLGLGRAAATEGPRWVALAAVALAMCLSTTGAEVAAQAILIGLVLAGPRSARALQRLAASIALGVALAAFALLPVWALLSDSARGTGFPTAVVLAHSVHPLTFIQTFVAGFYGDPAYITGRWWGINFFTRGFPYVLSLYLGAGALCLALAGLLAKHPLRLRLAGLALLGAFVCLGKYAGLAYLVDRLPLLHVLRYPTKAFFTVHFAAAALAAIGLGDMLERGAAAWRRLALLAAGFGLVLASAPLLPRLLPGPTRFFLLGFCPPEYPWPLREAVLAFITSDAALGGLVLLALAGIAAVVSKGHLAPNAGAVAAAALVTADLLRAGAGLNPSVTRSFFFLSPETARFASEVRAVHGRVFSCAVDSSPSYFEARLRRGIDHESLTFAAFLEMLTPDFNVPFGVRTALSIDRTMLVPEARITSPEESTCRDLAALVPRLRAAGVTHVLSLEALQDESLVPLSILEPARMAPLRIHAYRLREPLPYVELLGASGLVLTLGERPGAVDLDVEAAGAATVLVREAFAPGWVADVDGRTARVVAERGGHSSVPVPGGRSRVRLRYQPPGARLGAVTSAAAALVCWTLLARRSKASAG